MSYLTYIPLNAYRMGTKRLTLSRQVAHASVLQSFAPSQDVSGDSGRILWRIDSEGRNVYLTILSPEKPSPEHIVESCGWNNAEDSFQQVDYSTVLDSLSEGQEYEFSITVNPVTAVTGSNRRNPVDADLVGDWLSQKMLTTGAETRDVQLGSYGMDSFRRGNGTVTLAVAKVSGVVVVNSPDDLRSILLNGIGRAKGYGCGLLLLENKIS